MPAHLHNRTSHGCQVKRGVIIPGIPTFTCVACGTVGEKVVEDPDHESPAAHYMSKGTFGVAKAGWYCIACYERAQNGEFCPAHQFLPGTGYCVICGTTVASVLEPAIEQRLADSAKRMGVE